MGSGLDLVSRLHPFPGAVFISFQNQSPQQRAVKRLQHLHEVLGVKITEGPSSPDAPSQMTVL